LIAAAVAVIASTAQAQEGPMPGELAWKPLEIGRVVDQHRGHAADR